MKRKIKHDATKVILLDIFQVIADNKRMNGYYRTADNYCSLINKLKRYLNGDYVNLCFKDVTAEWVSAFVRWLKECHHDKPQTANFYYRNFRALYNKACVELNVVHLDGFNPFSQIVLSEKYSAKRALVQQEVAKLTIPKFRESIDEHLSESLDVLLFILYMRGMVFQDVYNLTWDMIDKDNHVHYLRNKTKVPIDAEISLEARDIIERYRNKDCCYVFPFLHYAKKGNLTNPAKKEISEQISLRRINRHASLIGKSAGLSIPLSTYVMRHTFATLMLEAGKPIEIISQCLGHSSIRTTQIYLSRISVAKVDMEVDEMINQMLRPANKESQRKVNKNNASRMAQNLAQNNNNFREEIEFVPNRKDWVLFNNVSSDKKNFSFFSGARNLFLYKKEIETFKEPSLSRCHCANIVYLFIITSFCIILILFFSHFLHFCFHKTLHFFDIFCHKFFIIKQVRTVCF